LANEQKGKLGEAIDSFQKAIALSRETVPYMAGLGHAYALAGKKPEARRVLDELNRLSKSRYVSPSNNAMIYLGLGEKDQAITWLQKALEERSSWVIYFRADPRLDSLRASPQFQELMRRAGLPL
jgi:Flp pilus assembly protein TadD